MPTVAQLVKDKRWLGSIIPKLRQQPTAHRELDYHRRKARAGGPDQLPVIHVLVGDDGEVIRSGVIDGNHRLTAASEVGSKARVQLRIEMGGKEVPKTVVLPLRGLKPQYVGRAKRPMSEHLITLDEACGTFHGKDGKFCKKDDANLMSRAGEQYKFVRRHTRKKSGTEVDRYPRRPGKKKSRAMEAIRTATVGRQKLVREGQEFAEVEMDREKLIALAKEAADADPKKRFSGMSIRRHLAKKLGVEYVQLSAKGGGRWRELKEIEALVGGKDAVFIRDRARGFFKIKKVTAKKKGLSFQKEGRDQTLVLYNKEPIGEIERTWGLKRGATRESEWTYDVYLDREELAKLGIDTQGKVPGQAHMRGLNDAKKWVKDYLKRHLPK